MHDKAVHTYVLFDELEYQTGHGHWRFGWDNKGWIGRDLDRLWFHTEGETHREDLEAAEVQLLYGRAVARWWDVMAGVRQDFGPAPNRTWAVIGIQGLAPYWFEVEAAAFVATSGHTQFRVEAEYEVLLTNRLVLQPKLEVDFAGRADHESEVAAGLTKMDGGLRLRYELRREFAPYVGLSWERKFFGTRRIARREGLEADGARLVGGLRVWF